jgi:hypothetical protein
MSPTVIPRTSDADTFGERHYTIAELAQMWAISYEAVRRLFAREPGVFRLRTKPPRYGGPSRKRRSR